MMKRTIEFINLPNTFGETWLVTFDFIYKIYFTNLYNSLYDAVLSDRESLVKEIIKNKGNVNFANS